MVTAHSKSRNLNDFSKILVGELGRYVAFLLNVVARRHEASQVAGVSGRAQDRDKSSSREPKRTRPSAARLSLQPQRSGRSYRAVRTWRPGGNARGRHHQFLRTLPNLIYTAGERGAGSPVDSGAQRQVSGSLLMALCSSPVSGLWKIPK